MDTQLLLHLLRIYYDLFSLGFCVRQKFVACFVMASRFVNKNVEYFEVTIRLPNSVRAHRFCFTGIFEDSIRLVDGCSRCWHRPSKNAFEFVCSDIALVSSSFRGKCKVVVVVKRRDVNFAIVQFQCSFPMPRRRNECKRRTNERKKYIKIVKVKVWARPTTTFKCTASWMTSECLRFFRRITIAVQVDTRVLSKRHLFIEYKCWNWMHFR